MARFVEVKGLNEALAKLGRQKRELAAINRRAFTAGAQVVQAEARKNLEKSGAHRTRRLINSVGYNVLEADSSRVRAEIGPTGNEGKIGRYVEEGTGLYGPKGRRIVPNTKKALAFTNPGLANLSGSLSRTKLRRASAHGGKPQTMIIVKSIKGMRKRPWLAPALKDHLKQIREAIIAVYTKGLSDA